MSDVLLGRGVAGSWMNTVQSIMGSRLHKSSFVVLDAGQSGCITLAEWFSAHKAIAFQEDILSQAVRFPRMSIYQRIRQSANDVYGFNVSVEQLRQVQRIADPNQFLQDLRRGGCRIIFLNRRDMLRHAIATLRAYSLNCRFDMASNEADTAPRSQFTIDVAELLDCLKYMDNQRLEAQAMLYDLPYLSLTYEDDLMNPNSHEGTAKRLSEFLEIPNIKPTSSKLKLVHQQLADIVENHDELCEGVGNSEYAYLLTDSRYIMTV